MYEFPNKADDMVSTQIVKEGETLQPVVIPENTDTAYFYGWYIVELQLDASRQATAEAGGSWDDVSSRRYVYKWTDNPQVIDTNTPITGIEQDEDVYLAPLYTNYRFVTFHESERVSDQPSNIVARKIVALGDNQSADIRISDVTAVSPDPQKLVFYGWSYETVENGETVTKQVQTRLATGDEITKFVTVTDNNLEAGGSIDLYPIFKQARWITFVHGQAGWNAKYVGSIFAYLYDPEDPDPATLTELPSTTRPGYIFDGWYTGHMEKEDGVDVIRYDEDGQVTMEFDSEDETGNTAVYPYNSRKVVQTTVNDWGQPVETFIDTDQQTKTSRLYLRDSLTLYAKWRPADAADKFTIDSIYADEDGCIRFAAAYEPEKETVRRTDVTSLVLDANSGYAVKNKLDEYEDYVYVDLAKNQVLFTKQVNNFDVNLHDYYNNFSHADGYMLLGWDESQSPENFIPRYAADAVIGADSTGGDNLLYAAWEAMYYLTLQNFSTDYDITFTLRFTGYGGNVYSGNTNTVVSTFERKLFSEEKDGLVTVEKQSPGVFTVTMKKATERDKKGNVVPTQIKLVLPEGEGAGYSVTGSVANTKNADGTSIETNYGTLNVYNSGGASDKIYYNNKWYNINNQQTSDYAVSGSMKLGREGQTVAFYSQEPEKVSVYLQAWYYDISNGWTDDRDNDSGPNASLRFEDYEGIGGTTTSDGTGITGLEIIKNSSYSFSVNQSYANTGQYKFIGWYAEPEAAPDAVSLDGKSNVFGDSKVTDISVPNEKVTHYYALYVPYTDGTLTLNHEERKESIGYAKRIYISADYNSKTYTDEEITSITNVSEYVDKAKATVNILVIEPRTDADNSAPIAITLKAMAGYGCTYNTTYEGARQLTTGARDTSSATDVFYDPTETDSSQPHETKYYYVYTLQKTIGEMYTASETVKGLRVLGNIDYYSDFKRKYEFVYNYVFRDGETPRKYVVTGETAQHSTQADFSRFVLEQAPYISNFGEDFAWNIASIQISNLNNKGKITASMDSVRSKKAMATVTVKSYNSAVEIKWQTEVGTAFPEGNRPVAEKVIDNKQFSHWEITNTDTRELVGRCYYHEFTFAVWDNYTLEPVYIDLPASGEYERVYPTADSTYVTLDYLDSTRNQWVNLDENGGYDSDALVYNDSLINDFDVTFIDRGNQIKTDASNYQLGLLFEIVDTVEPGANMNEYTLPEYTAADEALRDRAVNAIIAKNGTSGTINTNP